ncbi:MAG: hypothetical protein WED33_09990 [Bacteroidia bacterium]
MPELVELISPVVSPRVKIELPASKSLSNRILILEAVTNGLVKGIGYSDAEDSRNLKRCIEEKSTEMYVGEGGTTLRFLMAFLAATVNYEGVLRGSDRLMKRPVDALVLALNSLGAEVEIVNKDKEISISISGKSIRGGELELAPSESSQFASALLLAAPLFEQGLHLKLPKDFPSVSYLLMTVKLMQACGFDISVNKHEVNFNISSLKPVEIKIEKDWSSASYWYGIVSLLKGSRIELEGLGIDSLQGDASCVDVFKFFGVKTTETESGIVISNEELIMHELAFDVAEFPDLFPTLAFTAAAKRMKIYFSGLSTLRVKESDRVEAVMKELAKVGVKSSLLNSDLLMIDAKELRTDRMVIFETYDDHRIAMGAAILSTVLWKAAIRNPHVVGKSYPSFWQQLSLLGFSVKEFAS